MAYKIVYSRHALKDIKKLDSIIKKKIGKTITQCSQNPFHYAVKLTSSEIGNYRWRAGNYRIIFDITGKRIEVLRIGHRREIYKKSGLKF
ncbi:MAG: Addiction module toxin, RelE/StbE family [Parcubacteria group bacterium GW2011_GWA1_Parcubacteria_45_10]|nr:MAG: Addiction module toxin, RelE/StbE family [Parcubacteria group bacterium GW2011_GWA1_Parcubacteria_45_10]